MMNIKNDLLGMKDEKYLVFHSKICKNVNLIGIRVPLLRRYAKKLYSENIGNIDNLLLMIDCEYYEEIMLRGMIIGLDKQVEINEFLKRVSEFIPLIDNWAVCDIFCADLKLTRNYEKQVFHFLQKYFNSNLEFELRFAIVMALDYFIKDEYIDDIFKLIDKIKNKDYYCEMSISWFLSVCLINYYDKTLEFLNNSSLSSFVYKKTIQKACESYRIDKNKKDYLKSLITK